MSVTRRGFLAALAAAFASPALAEFTYTPEELATFRPHPAFPTGLFMMHQEAVIEAPGDEYELLKGQVETPFGFRTLGLYYDSAVKVATLTQFLDSASVALFICKRCFFEGPVTVLPWQSRMEITPQILMAPKMPFELRLTNTQQLPEPVRIQTCFDGWLYEPGDL